MAPRQSFRPSAAPAPSQPVPQPPGDKHSLAGPIFARRNLIFFAAGLLAALGVVLLYRALWPPAPQVTNQDVAAAVEKALEKEAGKPSIPALAYQKVFRSLVLVRAEQPGGGKEEDYALGTGVVVEDTGAILTCLHVVQGAVRVSVIFHDGFESEAQVTGIRVQNDLAVLQAAVAPEGLVPATLAGSAHLQVGDPVVAVGHPFGIPNSVTAGVVSGLGRSFTAPQTGVTLSNLIQFDAAVNPGNSGGPLLDREGDVVGIVTALLNPVEQEFFVGIGFAVTTETAAAAFGIPPW